MSGSDYKVGKGRPPLKTRFQPGNKEHLKRRPRETWELRHKIIRDALSTVVEYRDNGKVKRATRIEVQIKKLCAEASKGDISAAAELVQMYWQFKLYGDLRPLTLVFDYEDQFA